VCVCVCVIYLWLERMTQPRSFGRSWTTQTLLLRHDPAGSTLCIHSVVIRPDRRRQGLATGPYVCVCVVCVCVLTCIVCETLPGPLKSKRPIESSTHTKLNTHPHPRAYTKTKQNKTKQNKAMLREYIEQVLADVGSVVRVRLIAKVHNLGLYQRCGFRILRLSPVVHGKDPWFEMGLGACGRLGCVYMRLS
jgi:GNAT superfamily N-acetyltransferase